MHEALDELQLLEVLLAEVCAVRAREQEELQHDGQHAVEMPGARGALELVAERVLGHAVAVAVAVDLLRAGQEREVATGAVEHLEVALGVPRVALEVARVVELRRVHENARPGTCVLRLGAANEGQVPFVQGAERRHEAGRARAAGAAMLEEFGSALDDLHAS